MHDLAHDGLRSLVRAVVRPARPILELNPVHAGLELESKAVRPTLRGRPRDVEIVSRLADAPTIDDDQLSKPASSKRGERSVSVGHEGLQGEGAVPRQLHSTPGGLRYARSI